MTQFVLASHGNYAMEALKSASMICGTIPTNVSVLSVQDGGLGIEEFRKDAKILAKKLEKEPVLILSDLFGGSPFMILLSEFRNCEYKVITGFNLPMLIQMYQSINGDLQDAADSILNIGQNESIKIVDKIVTEEEEK